MLGTAAAQTTLNGTVEPCRMLICTSSASDLCRRGSVVTPGCKSTSLGAGVGAFQQFSGEAVAAPKKYAIAGTVTGAAPKHPNFFGSRRLWTKLLERSSGDIRYVQTYSSQQKTTSVISDRVGLATSEAYSQVHQGNYALQVPRLTSATSRSLTLHIYQVQELQHHLQKPTFDFGNLDTQYNLNNLTTTKPLTSTESPIHIFTDSTSALSLSHKLGLNKRSKHIALRYLFVQDLEGRNRAVVIAEAPARVIAAIRIASVRWSSF